VTFTCRRATASDTAALLEVHRAAFSSDVEADLVAALLTHRSAQPAESWVAVAEGAVVGHVLLTPGLVPRDSLLSVLLLCSLAVLPTHQHAGVGSALTRAALDAASDAGVRAVSVFGDPGYYCRFGFRSLLPTGPLPAFDVAPTHEAAWQTLMLSDDPTTRGALDGSRIQWADPVMTPALWQG
jgi:putative acetyltransferase